MNKSQRIQLSSGTTNADKYIKVQLEQNVDTLEFLSMSLETKDIYQDFNADYGVLIGRVTANGGLGIANAKISIFIPLSDIDAENSEIKSLYPYKTPRDKNNDGKRYNLLPRVAKINPVTEVSSPKQPFGSFPIKEELVTNVEYLNVYKKYYKYTALTNSAGDYMIFGVPTGLQTVHLSVDVTDIGEYSMNPASMITNLGYSSNLFTDDGSKIKPSSDLEDLPNIETQEITVDIIPFWGDSEIFTIGITRQDFRIRAVLNNTFVIFGSAFTDGENAMWSENKDGARIIYELFYARTPAGVTYGMASKRAGKITEKIYYYPASVTDAQIDNNTVDPTVSMAVLDTSEYSIYKRDGDFVFIISCNRNKVITDEFGVQQSVSNDSPNGIFTKFRGFITLEITSNDIPMNFSGNIGDNTRVVPFRYKLKFPQYAVRNASFSKTTNGFDTTNTNTWRKQSYEFSGGKLYSIARFHGTTKGKNEADSNKFHIDGEGDNGFFWGDIINQAYDTNPNDNVGIIINQDYTDGDFTYTNSKYQFPSNIVTDTGYRWKGFGANWMNLTVYLPQLGYVSEGYSYILDVRSADHFTKQRQKDNEYNDYYFNDNTQKIAAGEINTKWFARSDLHWTDLIEVPKTDILKMNDIKSKGFMNTDITSLSGTAYRNATVKPTSWPTPVPFNGGKTTTTASPSSPVLDTKTYFYKGFNQANCIEYIISLGLV